MTSAPAQSLPSAASRPKTSLARQVEVLRDRPARLPLWEEPVEKCVCCPVRVSIAGQRKRQRQQRGAALVCIERVLGVGEAQAVLALLLNNSDLMAVEPDRKGARHLPVRLLQRRSYTEQLQQTQDATHLLGFPPLLQLR